MYRLLVEVITASVLINRWLSHDDGSISVIVQSIFRDVALGAVTIVCGKEFKW